MNKLSCFIVILVFMILASGISQAGQTIDLSNLTIGQATAGNGSPANNGKRPFSTDLSGNTLNLGEGVSVLNSPYICGALAPNWINNEIAFNNILNINKSINSKGEVDSLSFFFVVIGIMWGVIVQM